MTEEFTTSTGITFHDQDGSLFVDGTYFGSEFFISALREFFTYERDVMLNRWRRKDRPYYVVKEVDGSAHIYNEWSGTFAVWSKEDIENGRSGWGRGTAHEYFEEHPKAKLWHNAKPGEVWAVKTKHNEQERPVFVNNDGDFENTEEYFHPEFREITSGYRVWPVE